jgi:histidinol-phosphate aminotransferase
MTEYERVAPTTGLRLHLNENTAGCSPKVLAALQAVTREQAAFYPDYDRATKSCAARLGVTAAETVLTNGLDEGILAVAMSAMRLGRERGACEALIPEPAFDMYASCSDAVGARLVHVGPSDDLEFPFAAMLDAISPRTAAVFLTSPNNPTGMPVDRKQILQVIERAQHALILLDEAYADFARTTFIGDRDLARFPNVIVGRTFAKAYGLAGLASAPSSDHRPPSNRSGGCCRRTPSTPTRLRRWRRHSRTSTTTTGISDRSTNRESC